MADLALTAASIAVVHPGHAETYDFITAAAITKGQIVYIDANGKADLADGSAAGTAAFRGIALKGVAAGDPVSVLVKGACHGFTITQAYDADLYVSDTAGAIGDAAGTVTNLIGRIMPLSNSDITKVVYVDGFSG